MSNVGEKIELSRDEFRNITKCLENEEFRKLFAEYCEEINNPENKKQFEKELKILEAERGYDVKFIKPLPGYVIKTVVGGTTKAFINVCHCDVIAKPVSKGAIDEKGQKGFQWSIPFAQSHPRKDYDNKKSICWVYDVVFHFDTLHLANQNANFRKLVTDTALDAVQNSFKVSLDTNNLKYPKLQYKGVPKMTVIRQKIQSQQKDEENNDNDQTYPVSKQPVILDDNKENENRTTDNCSIDYTTPSYKLLHRKGVEIHELTNELDAKLHAAIPKELVLIIDLPLLRSAGDCTLNVTSKILHLVSEKPAKYLLEVKLPYEVVEKDGTAKFNTDEKTLTVSLPVAKTRRALLNDINISKKSECQTTLNADISMEAENVGKSTEPTKPPKAPQVISNNATRKIIFPKFSANKMDNIFAFTLNVRNVDPSSIQILKGVDTVSCRFTNIGSGFFPCYYVFFVRFPNTNITEVQHEEWDNNLILQVVLDNSNIDCYYAGADKDDAVQYSIMEDISDKINNFGKEIEDDSLCIAVSKTATKRERKSSLLSIEIKTKDESDADDDENDIVEREHKTVQSPIQEINTVKTNKISTETSTKLKIDVKHIDEYEKLEKRDDCSEAKKSKKNSRRKNKKRSLSESSCDQLKVIVENEISKLEPNIGNNNRPLEDSKGDNGKAPFSKQRKARSISESSTANSHPYPCSETCSDSTSMDNLTALIQFNHKYKGILKRSTFERSISECSSTEDPLYLGTSVEGCSISGSVEHGNGELSESCRKTVRFNDSIKTKIFRSNTSILGQKKKNAKKNESKRRALSRRLSEGESTDNEDKENSSCNEAHLPGIQAEHEYDSGISLDSEAGISVEKDNEYNDHIEPQNETSKPIDITGKVSSINKKEDSNKKVKQLNQSVEKHANSNDIEYKSDMIFDIEM